MSEGSLMKTYRLEWFTLHKLLDASDLIRPSIILTACTLESRGAGLYSDFFSLK